MRCIPMGHGSGLRSDAHRGMVCFALAAPHGNGMLPDQFGMGTICLRCIEAPFRRRVLWVRHEYGTV